MNATISTAIKIDNFTITGVRIDMKILLAVD